jgi:hypothetical protein
MNVDKGWCEDVDNQKILLIFELLYLKEKMIALIIK